MKLVLEMFRITERRYVNNEQIENKFEWKGGRIEISTYLIW